MVHELLERGADPNAQNEDGYTLLGLACERPVIDMFYVSKLRLQDRAKMHVGSYVSGEAFGGTDKKMITTKMGSTIKVVSHDNAEESKVLPTEFESIIRMLLDKGADIDADIYGQTALAVAAENEYLTLFRTLLAAGADITRVDTYILEQLRRMLRQDDGCKGVYGKACLGTLQDFQTHDYCVLLLNFMIPYSFIMNLQEIVTTDDSRALFGNMIDFNDQLRLSSGGNAERSHNVERKWTAQKEYDQRVKEKFDREPTELLAMIASALDEAEASRRVCMRDEFWAFGGWGTQFTDDVQLEARFQHSPWWTKLVCRGLTGITTYEVPILVVQVPKFRWKPPGQDIIEPYRVGLTKRTDFWMFPRTSRRNMRRFGHLLLKSFLIWRHCEKVWEDGMADFSVCM